MRAQESLPTPAQLCTCINVFILLKGNSTAFHLLFDCSNCRIHFVYNLTLFSNTHTKYRIPNTEYHTLVGSRIPDTRLSVYVNPLSMSIEHISLSNDSINRHTHEFSYPARITQQIRGYNLPSVPRSYSVANRWMLWVMSYVTDCVLLKAYHSAVSIGFWVYINTRHCYGKR